MADEKPRLIYFLGEHFDGKFYIFPSDKAKEGFEHFKREDFDKACECFRRANDWDDDDSGIEFCMDQVEKLDFDERKRCPMTYVMPLPGKTDPSYLPCYYNWGRRLMKRKD